MQLSFIRQRHKDTTLRDPVDLNFSLKWSKPHYIIFILIREEMLSTSQSFANLANKLVKIISDKSRLNL